MIDYNKNGSLQRPEPNFSILAKLDLSKNCRLQLFCIFAIANFCHFPNFKILKSQFVFEKTNLSSNDFQLPYFREQFPQKLFFFGSVKCGNFHIVSELWQYFYFIKKQLPKELSKGETISGNMVKGLFFVASHLTYEDSAHF